MELGQLVAATFETNRVDRLQLDKLDLGDLTKCEQSKLARMRTSSLSWPDKIFRFI